MKIFRIYQRYSRYFICLAGQLALLCFLIVRIRHSYNGVICQKIDIQIKDPHQQHLLTKEQILQNPLVRHYISTLIHQPIKDIDVSLLVKTIKTIPAIKQVTATKLWQGIIKVDIETKCIIARIIDAPYSPCYIDECGGIIHAQPDQCFNIRVLRGVSINSAQSIKGKYPELLTLLQYIHHDKFLHYQITSIQLLENKKVILGTQIGNQIIEFGKIEHIKHKFEKLHIFYKHIIPYKGWGAYHRVNLEFHPQIICE